MEMAYCRMIYLCYPSSTRIWTRLSAWFVRTLCFSRVLSAYVMLRKSVWRLLSFLVQDAEWDGHICLLLLENCLLQSLVVVKVFSLPMCTFDALIEQLWLVKLSENHNRIYRKVRVMLQGCRACCTDCSFKKKWNEVSESTFSQTGIYSWIDPFPGTPRAAGASWEVDLLNLPSKVTAPKTPILSSKLSINTIIYITIFITAVESILFPPDYPSTSKLLGITLPS